MSKWGKTAAGSTRWFCKYCRISGTRKRKDNRERERLFLFVRWLTTKTTLQALTTNQHITVKTLFRWFTPFWLRPPVPRLESSVRVLVLDATSVVPRQCMLLIAGDGDRLRPVSWMPAPRECYTSWTMFLAELQKVFEPSFVVCDGQRGMLKAIHEIWPHTKIQRCLIHVMRQACGWLTQNPKTKAGRELLILVRCLSDIRTKRQKRRWIRAFRYWNRRHTTFLKERTYSFSGRWWYTHRKLRGTRSLLRNAIPDLFRFVTDPSVPRTSNHVEGGLNSRLKELFRCHRGISTTKKLALASWYLALRQGQKPTRNVY
ncbi:MAG: transposase [Candidatus Uhrbacteria bacterium]|nr:transposase [Candidatus Uhrbacteria bacterium]MDP3793392.1 transposase [Candidatus Uhrbacteria bacterium]